MLCPVCKGEFVPGILVCNSCDVELVEALPDAPPPPSLDLIEVASFPQPVDAQMAASYLEANGISVVAGNEHTLGLNWWFSTALGGVHLAVPREQVETARDLLSALNAPTTAPQEPPEFAGGHVPPEDLAHTKRTNRIKVLLTLLIINPVFFILGSAGLLSRRTKGPRSSGDSAA